MPVSGRCSRSATACRPERAEVRDELATARHPRQRRLCGGGLLMGLCGFAVRVTGHRLAAFVVATVIAGAAATAWAYWTATATAGSNGAATAATVNQGATPSASLTSVGREVTVSWGVSTLSNGVHVDGYLVERYPSGGGIGTISPIGSCSGRVTSASCVEDDVPAGSWRYTITPAIGSW